jgi:plasmid maintenance system antidote protein VapI
MPNTREYPVPYYSSESVSAGGAVTFGALQRRLIRFVVNRIANGDFSERGLARVLRVSQPQLHKVLKGERKLTPELADKVLLCFGMTVVDLLDTSDLAERFGLAQATTAGPSRVQRDVASHVQIRRIPAEREISRKHPNRESSAHPKTSTKAG